MENITFLTLKDGELLLQTSGRIIVRDYEPLLVEEADSPMIDGNGRPYVETEWENNVSINLNYKDGE